MAMALQLKIEQFVSSLTPEEEAQLHQAREQDDPSLLSPALEDKVRRTTESLSDDERAAVRDLEWPSDQDAGDAEVEGFRIKLPRPEANVGIAGEPPRDGGGGAGLGSWLWNNTPPLKGASDGIKAIKYWF